MNMTQTATSQSGSIEVKKDGAYKARQLEDTYKLCTMSNRTVLPAVETEGNIIWASLS